MNKNKKNNSIFDFNYHTKRKLIAYLLIAPALLILIPFFIYPLIKALINSLFYNGNFVGIENYIYLFTGEGFWNSLRVTFVFSFAFTIISVSIALLLAFLLQRSKWLKGKYFFRTTFFFPQVVSLVIVALVWQYMLDGNFGIFNYILNLLNFESVSWLQNTTTAIISLIIVQVWYTLGYNMLLLLSGLQAIDDSYYEAARIDGANWFQQLYSITIPLLLPSLLFVILISLLNGFVNSFVLADVLTQGGPVNSTNVLVLFIYNLAFNEFDLETANALTMITFGIMFVFAYIQNKIQEKSNYSIND